jgi:hypothetical protein
MKIIAVILAAATVATTAIEALSLDGILGIVAPWGFHEDTRYAPGYSTSAFRSIQRGEPEEHVTRVLGSPLTVSLVYESAACRVVWIRGAVVADTSSESCAVTPGQSADAVRRLLGPPTEEHWLYSESPSDQSYRERVVIIRDRMVAAVKSGYYID